MSFNLKSAERSTIWNNIIMREKKERTEQKRTERMEVKEIRIVSAAKKREEKRRDEIRIEWEKEKGK